MAAQFCTRAAGPFLAGACPLLPSPSVVAYSNASNTSGASFAANGAWDLLSRGGGGNPTGAPCAAAMENYLVAEGCCAATVAAAGRRWRADVLSHPGLGRRFRVAWGGGRLQVLSALPSRLPSGCLI